MCNNNRRYIYLGFILAFLAAFGAAVADVIPKPILGDYESSIAYISPIVFVAILFVINTVIFGTYAIIVNILKKPSSKLTKNHIILLIGAGIAEALGTILYYEGLRRTFASDASIISNSEIFFGVILAMILFHEVIKRREILPVVLILIGSILIPIIIELEQNSFAVVNITSEGNVMIVLSGVLFATYATIYKYVMEKKQYDFGKILSISFISGALFCVFILLLFKDLHSIQIPRSEDITSIFLSGFVGIGLSSLFFVMAIKRIGLARTNIVYSSSPIFAVIIALIYLTEEFQMYYVVAILFMSAGIVLLKDKIRS